MKAEVSCAPAGLWPEEDRLPTRGTLLSRLRNVADETSWRLFFDNYWKLIYHAARKAGLSDADAQDVVQEVVISVARRIPEFRYDPGKGSFRRWLLLITRRRIQDHLRRLYRSPVLCSSGVEAGVESAETLAAPTLAPDEAMDAVWEAEWRANLFQAALARVRQRVSPKQYQVFDYCVLQKVRAGDVASMLGLTLPQVYLAKHRITRALKRTAAELEAELNQCNGC